MKANSATGVVQVTLNNFRSYHSERLVCDHRPVVLTGENGSGKTNILEALSFLSPGRGLRGAPLSDVLRQESDKTEWGIAVNLKAANDDITQLSTGLGQTKTGADKRIVRINRAPVTRQESLLDHISVLWLTPSMDQMFQGGPQERRRFLDKLVASIDPLHNKRLYQYDHALRERSKLLRDGGRDPHWLATLEEKLAHTGVAIVSSRRDVVDLLQAGTEHAYGDFPSIRLEMSGEVETLFENQSAVDVEDHIKTFLSHSRNQDAERGGARIGPHRSDMLVFYKTTNKPAAQCSTGEQKALLLSLVFSAIRLYSLQCKGLPILLLDEVVAHLDQHRKEQLFEEVIHLGLQTWMTGTDKRVFTELSDHAQYMHVQRNGTTSSVRQQ